LVSSTSWFSSLLSPFSFSCVHDLSSRCACVLSCCVSSLLFPLFLALFLSSAFSSVLSFLPLPAPGARRACSERTAGGERRKKKSGDIPLLLLYYSPGRGWSSPFKGVPTLVLFSLLCSLALGYSAVEPQMGGGPTLISPQGPFILSPAGPPPKCFPPSFWALFPATHFWGHPKLFSPFSLPNLAQKFLVPPTKCPKSWGTPKPKRGSFTPQKSGLFDWTGSQRFGTPPGMKKNVLDGILSKPSREPGLKTVLQSKIKWALF